MDELSKLRKQIDAIDMELLDLITKRLNIAERIAEHKKKNNMPIYDAVREKAKLQKLKEEAKLRLLDENQIETLFKEIIKITRENEHG